MLTLNAPPYVEIRLAETEPEKALLQHHTAFHKSPADGMRRRDVDRVATQWRDQVSVNSLLDQADQFEEVPGKSPLSLGAVQEEVKRHIITANGKAGCCGVFYILYTQNLEHVAAGVRDHLEMSRMREDRTQEFNGVLVKQERPATYWLPVIIDGQEQRMEVAFYQENELVSISGKSVWLVMPYPIGIKYLPADQPAMYLAETYAFDPTELVERKAFTALKDEATKRGVRFADEMHEPNGHQKFPDYKVQMDGRDWVVEVTRLMGAIPKNRVITTTERYTRQSISRAASQPGIDSNDIDAAIRQALNDKSRCRKCVASNELYCLLLVDVMDLVDQNDTGQWAKYDDELAAFDSVALVQIEPGQPDAVTVIKGSILSPDAAN